VSAKKFLTVEDISQLFGIDETTIQSLVDAGELKALPDRGTFKFRHDDLTSLIQSGRLQATKELPTVDDIDFDDTLGFASEQEPTSSTDFLELDEAALSGAPPEPVHEPGESFLLDDTGPSSSDVKVFSPGASESSDSDIQLGRSAAQIPTTSAPSSSDVQALTDSAAAFSMPKDETPATPFAGADSDQGLVLDFDDDTPAYNPALAATGPYTGSDSVLMEGDAAGAEDSGISLQAADSGITLASDSGISLAASDSGITLAADSGLSLSGVDSGISLGKTDGNMNLAADLGGTQEIDPFADLSLADESQDEIPVPKRPQPKHDEDEETPTLSGELGSDQTAVLMLDDSGEAPAFAGGLSGAIAAGESVADLDLSDDLDAAVSDEILSAADEDEVVDASDEAFSDEFEGDLDGGEEEEEFAAPVAAGPREPTWGTFAPLMVIAASALVGVNGWLMWEGLATMWTGAETSGPASSIISSLAGLF
jgi:hypothetical protein